jgi:hypothetical protein
MAAAGAEFEKVVNVPISPVVNGPIWPVVKGPMVPVVNLIEGMVATMELRGATVKPDLQTRVFPSSMGRLRAIRPSGSTVRQKGSAETVVALAKIIEASDR